MVKFKISGPSKVGEARLLHVWIIGALFGGALAIGLLAYF